MKRMVAAISVVIVALTACSGGSYSTQDREEFVEVCAAASDGLLPICTCVFDKIEVAFSRDQFAEIGEKIEAGTAGPPPEFAQFGAECVDEVTQVVE